MTENQLSGKAKEILEKWKWYKNVIDSQKEKGMIDEHNCEIEQFALELEKHYQEEIEKQRQKVIDEVLSNLPLPDPEESLPCENCNVDCYVFCPTCELEPARKRLRG